MTVPHASERIVREVTSWPGVEAHPHQFGGTEFLVGRRALGHIHGDALLDAAVPRADRDRLIAEGRAIEHRFVPGSGWITIPFRTNADVDQAIEVLRAAYERFTAPAGSRTGT